MYGIYMLTFTINIPQMLAYIPYMDPILYFPVRPGDFPIQNGYGNPQTDRIRSNPSKIAIRRIFSEPFMALLS